MSTPISRASLRTDGEAGIIFPLTDGSSCSSSPLGTAGSAARSGSTCFSCTDRSFLSSTAGSSLTSSSTAGVTSRCASSLDACFFMAARFPRCSPFPESEETGAAFAASCLAGTLARPSSFRPDSTVSTVSPTLAVEPSFTRISLTTPATDDGTSIVALSVSSSMTGWSCIMVSPTATNTFTTFPDSMFSPSSGNFSSVVAICI